MTLSSWIDKMGNKHVAGLLSVDPSTVSNWRNLKTCPTPLDITTINVLSNGAVTYADVIDPYSNARMGALEKSWNNRIKERRSKKKFK